MTSRTPFREIFMKLANNQDDDKILDVIEIWLDLVNLVGVKCPELFKYVTLW